MPYVWKARVSRACDEVAGVRDEQCIGHRKSTEKVRFQMRVPELPALPAKRDLRVERGSSYDCPVTWSMRCGP